MGSAGNNWPHWWCRATGCTREAAGEKKGEGGGGEATGEPDIGVQVEAMHAFRCEVCSGRCDMIYDQSCRWAGLNRGGLKALSAPIAEIKETLDWIILLYSRTFFFFFFFFSPSSLWFHSSIALTSTLRLCGPLISETVWCFLPCSLLSEGFPLITWACKERRLGRHWYERLGQ